MKKNSDKDPNGNEAQVCWAQGRGSEKQSPSETKLSNKDRLNGVLREKEGGIPQEIKITGFGNEGGLRGGK